MRLCLAALLLLSTVLVALALTQGEERALLNIFESNPTLGSLNPRWSENTSAACDAPGFYGLTCSADTDPHIIGLCVSFFV